MKPTNGTKFSAKNILWIGIFSVLVPAIVAALTTKAMLSASGFDDQHGPGAHSHHAPEGSDEGPQDGGKEVAGKKPVPTPSVPQGQGKGCSPGHPHGDIWQVRNEQAKGFELKKCWEGSETTLIDYKD